MGETAAMPESDRAWMIDTLLALLQTPSPSGRTDAVMQLIGDIFNDFGVPFSLTRRGALIAELPGESRRPTEHWWFTPTPSAAWCAGSRTMAASS